MAVEEVGEHFAPATSVALNCTLWAYDGTGDAQYFEVEIPSAGYLMVDVAAPVAGAAQPKLGFLGQHCAGVGSPGKDFVYVDQFVSAVVVKLEFPGTYWFRAAAQDPLLPLAEYQLRIGFVKTSSDLGVFNKSEEQSEIDDDLSENDGGSEADPDPLPIPIPGAFPVPIKVFAGCYLSGVDDHGDALSCATPLRLGENMGGELHHGFGDDVDTLTFALTAQQTVRIETTGDADTVGELYDRRGHRLAAADDGGSDGNFRFVRTLGAGRYFVRVAAGPGGEGAYHVVVEPLSW
ncbi:MAG: hypothetical protein GY856_45505 [bacterium]|nr:hypothetical protein [bacterium]